MEMEKTINPLTERILNRVDKEIYKSFSHEQRIEIENAIDSFWQKGNSHAVDMRGMIPFTRVYFVFLMGTDQRAKGKKLFGVPRSGTPRSKQMLSAVIILMCIGCVVLISFNLFLLFPTLFNLISPASF